MNPITHLISGIRSFRPFLPAKEFETSLRFYEAIGFETHRLGDTLAELRACNKTHSRAAAAPASYCCWRTFIWLMCSFLMCCGI